MSNFRTILILLLFPLILGSTTHKFYVSITKIEFIEDQRSIQIISKIFIDDIEQTLQERYDTDVSLATDKETERDIEILKDYIFKKMNIQVNGAPVSLSFIGREYDIDIMKVYIEVGDISEVRSIEIENKILMDNFPEQQNIIHYKNKKTRKNLILDLNSPKGVLIFE
jgi:translation initiation factor IF-2